MAENRRLAIVEVSLDLLSEIIFKSPNVIRRARGSFDDFGAEVIEVIVEHESFAPVSTAARLPRKAVVFTKHADGSITYEFQDGRGPPPNEGTAGRARIGHPHSDRTGER